MIIESEVIEYLQTELVCDVYAEKPASMPARFVLVEKTSSHVSDRLNSCTIAVQSYAESLFEAAALNESVKDAMEELATLDFIARCQLNSDYNFTDTTKKKYRYQAVFDIVFYKE